MRYSAGSKVRAATSLGRVGPEVERVVELHHVRAGGLGDDDVGAGGHGGGEGLDVVPGGRSNSATLPECSHGAPQQRTPSGSEQATPLCSNTATRSWPMAGSMYSTKQVAKRATRGAPSPSAPARPAGALREPGGEPLAGVGREDAPRPPPRPRLHHLARRSEPGRPGQGVHDRGADRRDRPEQVGPPEELVRQPLGGPDPVALAVRRGPAA